MSFECCFNCKQPKRHPGCHDRCPEYTTDLAKFRERKAVEDRKKAINSGLDAQAIAGVYQARKRRKGRWE